MEYALHVEYITKWLSLTHEVAGQIVSGLIWPELATLLEAYWYKASRDERVQYTHVLPMLACGAVGGTPSQAIPLAACWQFKLLAAQLLDDLQDGSAGFWQILSDTDKLMAATLFLGAAEQCLTLLDIDLESHRLVAGKMGQMTMIAAKGQRMPKATSIAEYFKKITYKTGQPFGSVCVAGGIVGQASSGELRDLESFGLHIGVMRQIIDDCTDVREDLRMGEWTLPLFHLLSQNKSAELKAIMAKGRMSDQQITTTLALFAKYASLQWSLQQANERKFEARVLTKKLPSSKYLAKYVQL